MSANRPAKPFGALFNFQLIDQRCRPPRCRPRVRPNIAKRWHAVQIKVQLPRGTRYNPNGAPFCSFSELVDTGLCPNDSLLGEGSVAYNFAVNTGYLKVFHAYGEVRPPERPQAEPLGQGALAIFMNLDPALGPEEWLKGSLASMSRRGVLTITIPRPKAFGATLALTRLSFRIRKNAQLNGIPLLRTPRRCNPDKGWKTKTVVTYDNDSTETLFTRHPCYRRRAAP